MTSEQVRIALKLEPWKEFADKVIEERKFNQQLYTEEMWKRERFRMTGRSTRMLCSAVVAIDAQLSIKIYSAKLDLTKSLQYNLRNMAQKLGIKVMFSDKPDVEFFDHTYWEFPCTDSSK